MTTSRARGLPSFFILLLLCCLQSHANAGNIEKGSRHIEHPAWFQHGLIDLEADLETAASLGKQGVMVLYTTQGCTYCAEFIRASLGDDDIAQRVQQHFISWGLEIFDDTEMTDHQGNDLPVKTFAVEQKAGMAPTLLFYQTGADGENQLIYRAIGYQSPERFSMILDYLIGGSHAKLSFRDYLAERTDMPTEKPQGELRDDPLFIKPPYALERTHFASSQPLLVLFEAPGCEACEEFHDKVLSLDEVRETVDQFEVVRLDATDTTTPVITPNGNRMTPAEWYATEELSRLPALLFINEEGELVLKTDAVIERQRMLNASGLVLERAYEKGWTYQRFARSKAIERNQQLQE